MLLKAEEFLARAHVVVAAASVTPPKDREELQAAAQQFQSFAKARRTAIEAILWDESAGRWRDAWLEPCKNVDWQEPASNNVPNSEGLFNAFRAIATVANVSPEEPFGEAAQAAVRRGATVPLTTLPFLSDFAAPLWAGLADCAERQNRSKNYFKAQ